MNRVLYRIPVLITAAVSCAPAGEGNWEKLESDFRRLPMTARRLTGPLFWLHGDESRQRLEEYLEKVAAGGNGCFTAESRPHADWLGPGWYRDLGICLEKAKELDLQMYIFDERWWPSGEVGGKVPQRYGSKYLAAAARDVDGPGAVTLAVPGEKLVAVLAGRQTGAGIDGGSLRDLTAQVDGGTLAWEPPAGKWSVMTFTWRYSQGRRGRCLVDGASRDAVAWYIKTVYQPHYDHFRDDFGKTIRGFFYDEPETPGDWGTAVIPMLTERGVDWKKALVAWKFRLAGGEQAAARYQYRSAFAEAWGRTLYGGIADWCRDRGVISIGHWLEHKREYLHPEKCAGNMFPVQKYTHMGGIDLVCRQYYPGSKDLRFNQMATLGSSISHACGAAGDLAMCEIFGAYGQDITYPQMKWLTDQMQVRGINFMIPHSFNPRAPFDRDCPPYFYNGGYEPRWPLYRVYADYTSRLSLLLHGGRHVCPVALLFVGMSYHEGRCVPPEQVTTSLEDALLDCDWLPYAVFEEDAAIDGGRLGLHGESYRVLVVPPVEVIPVPALEKARDFFAAGGVVVGCGFLPSVSATLGRTADEVAALRAAIWGDNPEPSHTALQTSAAGGRSYFLPEKPTPAQLRAALVDDAGIRPTLDVIAGETGDWLHVLHRVKAGRDVFLVCNQDHEAPARTLRLSIAAAGHPEIWDAMRSEITAVPFRRDGERVELEITLRPSESVLVCFNPDRRPLPARIGPQSQPPRRLAVTRQPGGPRGRMDPPAASGEGGVKKILKGASWIWHPADGPAPPPVTRFFRRRFRLPAGARVETARLVIAADNAFRAFVNGRSAGEGSRWEMPERLDAAEYLRPGENVLAIRAANGGDGPNPAGLLAALAVTTAGGETVRVATGGDWKAAEAEQEGWTKPAFDDGTWQAAKAVAPFGGGPWGDLGGRRRLTLSPVAADTFVGAVTIPADLDPAARRVYLEAAGIAPEHGAAVRVNGRRAGGFICGPPRLEITGHLKAGKNEIVIAPFAPKEVWLTVRE